MTSRSIDLLISYQQFFVYDAAVPNPFAQWTEANSQQGFARTESSVTMLTILEDGRAIVRTHIGAFRMSTRYVRVIQVPFLAISGKIKIEAVGDQHLNVVSLLISPGHYALVAAQAFEEERNREGDCVDAGSEGDVEFVDLYFTKVDVPLSRSEILVRDQLLATSSPIVELAEPITWNVDRPVQQ